MSDQLFGLIAADLGGCKLVMQEDSGVLFYEDEVKLPDWRLTLLSDATSSLRPRPKTAIIRGSRSFGSETARLRRYVKAE